MVGIINSFYNFLFLNLMMYERKYYPRTFNFKDNSALFKRIDLSG
jgi:hypothetical protein